MSIERLYCKQSVDNWFETNLKVCSNSMCLLGGTDPDILRKCAVLFSMLGFTLKVMIIVTTTVPKSESCIDKEQVLHILIACQLKKWAKETACKLLIMSLKKNNYGLAPGKPTGWNRYYISQK